MNDRELFKIGFLKKCVEDGLDAEGTAHRVKAALDILGGAAHAVGTAIPYGLLGAAGLAAAPVVAGSGLGYLAAKATSGGDSEDAIARARSDETVGELMRLADQARRRTALKHALGQRTIASSGPLPPIR